MKRLLVTGSRTWTDEGMVYTELFKAFLDLGGPEQEITLVHGAAKGADIVAAKIWAERAGMPIEPHRAMWEMFGKRAGIQRNQEMVALGADLCLAFIRDSSTGASHCAAIAEEKGIPVRYFREVSNLGQAGDDNGNSACV